VQQWKGRKSGAAAAGALRAWKVRLEPTPVRDLSEAFTHRDRVRTIRPKTSPVRGIGGRLGDFL